MIVIVPAPAVDRGLTPAGRMGSQTAALACLSEYRPIGEA